MKKLMMALALLSLMAVSGFSATIDVGGGGNESSYGPFVPGEKVSLTIPALVGYTAKKLPSGLKLDNKTGEITGAAKKPTGEAGVTVTFAKKNEPTLTAQFVVGPVPTINVTLEGDTEKCKVTGANKAYLVGKKVSLQAKGPKGTAFVGWFKDGEPWPSEEEFLEPKIKYVMTKESLDPVACFEKEKMSIDASALESAAFAVGAEVAEGAIVINVETQSGLKSLKATKLPSGLKLKQDKKTGAWSIYGTPKKADSYEVKLTATAKSGAVESVLCGIVVDEAEASHEQIDQTPRPLKGIVLWHDTARAHPELNASISLEFAYMLPNDVARAQGDWDWSAVEGLLDDIRSRGHQAILRFHYVYPGGKTDGVRGATAVPAFIKSRDDYHETFARNPNGDGPTYYADWSCNALEDFTLDFYRAFAARYDQDPRLAFLEVGFGHWAEYHTCGTPTVPGRNFPTKSFQETFIRTVTSMFAETPVLVSIDAQDPAWSPLADDPVLRDLGFGLFDDSFMHRCHDLVSGDGYNERCWQRFPGQWKVGPCGGEISYYAKRDQREFLNPKGLYGVTWAAAAAKYHMTFVIANDCLEGPYATAARIAEAGRECGWRLSLTQPKTDGRSSIVNVTNVGVAPVYHDIRVRLGGETSSDSLKGLLPGGTRAFVFAPSNATPELTSRKLLKPIAFSAGQPSP